MCFCVKMETFLGLLANKLLSPRRLRSVGRLIAKFSSFFLICPAEANMMIVADRTIFLSSTPVILSFHPDFLASIYSEWR